MKKTFIRASLFLLGAIAVLVGTGTMPVVTGILAAIGVQAVAFAIALPRPSLFLTALTQEQLEEFSEIMNELKGFGDLLPKLKNAPEEIKEIAQKLARFDELQRAVDQIRRSSLAGGGRETIPPGSLVSDNCARHLVGLAIVAGQKKGRFETLESGKVETIMNMGKSFLGDAQFKTALTSSDIPLPVEYSGQVVALVNQFGSARRYGTVFPSGSGQLKLPRLKTRPRFGLLTQSAAITEKSPQTEWVTFNAEKFGGLIRLPSEMDEDSVIPLGNFIAWYAGIGVAEVEDEVFFMNLDGSTYGAVKGLCGSTIDNSKVVALASTKTAYSDATIGKLRELRNKPDASALRRGAYYMHPSFEQLLSGFNSGGDKPYNANAMLPNPSSVQPFITGPSFDGFPVRWVDAMPAYSTSANASKVFMLFGDLSYQYLSPRGPIRFQTSIDAAFETDEILMRALERFTIGLMATGAVAGLQTAAS